MFEIEPTLAERIREKDSAIRHIDALVAEIEADGRQPDEWQRVHVVEALKAVFTGLYPLALVEMEAARADPNERSPSAKLPTDAIYERADLAFIKRTLRIARAEPVRRFPFGPIDS